MEVNLLLFVYISLLFLIYAFRVEILKKYVFGVDLLSYTSIYNSVAASDNYVHEKASKESQWQALFYFYRWSGDRSFFDAFEKLDQDLLLNSYVNIFFDMINILCAYCLLGK